MAMEQALDGRLATPPAFSLLGAAAVVDLEQGGDLRLENGYSVDSETCGASGAAGGLCAPSAALPAITAPSDGYTARPFLVHAGDICTAMDLRRDGNAKARRLLLASQAESIEAELHDGTVSRAQAYGNPFLRDSATVTDLTPASGPVGPKGSLAILEARLAECRTRSTIHASIVGALHLPDVTASGRTWTTKLGSLVVPGTGYTGTGPIGHAQETPPAGQTWIYGTGIVDVVLGRIEDGQVAINRDTNTAESRALRLAVAGFDPCCHYAIRMVLATDENLPAA